MGRTNNDDLLMEEELLADEFFNDPAATNEPETDLSAPEGKDTPSDENDGWGEVADEFPGQLAVDVYETADKLIVKARTAGISKSDLNVSVSQDKILTISGVLSGGEDENAVCWHIQECYWGEFSRTIALPVQVREDEGSVKAELRDGVLTISFEKEKTEAPKKITIQ